MAPVELILPFDELDISQVLVDQEGLRTFNAHRFEMEQLTAVVYRNASRMVCAGYREIRGDEFWVRGNFPGQPALPSVLLCESAAQLCCYFVQTLEDFGTQVLALAGLDDVTFGQPVRIGDRVLIVGHVAKYRPGVLISWRFQGFVQQRMVCSGTLKGVPVRVPDILGERDAGKAIKPA